MKNAAQVEKELQGIRKRCRGALRPADVVAWAAKHPKSALHERFDWDDTEAAHKYRLWQARKVITRVTIVPRNNTKIRAFVSLTEDRGDGVGYRSVVEVLSDDERRERLLAQALAEFRRVRAKYHTLKELAEVDKAIAKVEKAAKKRGRRAA